MFIHNNNLLSSINRKVQVTCSQVRLSFVLIDSFQHFEGTPVASIHTMNNIRLFYAHHIKFDLNKDAVLPNIPDKSDITTCDFMITKYLPFLHMRVDMISSYF